MIFFSLLIFSAFCADRTIYEAESATLKGDCTVETSFSGYSGTGYVYMHDSESITWKVTKTSSGLFNIGFRYATELGARTQVISVNGKDYGYFEFPDNTRWTELVVVTRVPMRSGENTITVTKNYGWMYFDYMFLEDFVDVPFNISSTPVTPNPSAACQELYSFLVKNFQKKMISGVMTLQGGEEYSMVEPNWLLKNAGKEPALLGLDFMHQTGKESEWYYGDPDYSRQVVRDASAFWKRGGIPALCWHWRDPLETTNEFYSPSSGNSATQFSAEQAVKEGTPEYKAVMKDLAAVADQLEVLRDAGIAVLWRPLHEASGKWFWWGYKGPEPFKKLWKIEFDYFVKERKLNNLIWVFTAGTPTDGIIDWYPGDSMVDVIGMDIYPPQGDHSSQYDYYGLCKDVFKSQKIIALSECGSAPDPDLVQEDVSVWSYFMPWYQEYTIPEGDTPYNSLAFWKKMMSSSSVITLDQMPGWKATVGSLENDR